MASCRSVGIDRKSTRLNSSHLVISYAVFCLKKKKKKKTMNNIHKTPLLVRERHAQLVLPRASGVHLLDIIQILFLLFPFFLFFFFFLIIGPPPNSPLFPTPPLFR